VTVSAVNPVKVSLVVVQSVRFGGSPDVQMLPGTQASRCSACEVSEGQRVGSGLQDDGRLEEVPVVDRRRWVHADVCCFGQGGRHWIGQLGECASSDLDTPAATIGGPLAYFRIPDIRESCSRYGGQPMPNACPCRLDSTRLCGA
jgi:hypothetical protein